MNESQRTEAEDMLWLCNATDHERSDSHDYCLVHEVAFPSDEPCPETWGRLERVRESAVAEAWDASEVAEILAKHRTLWRPGRGCVWFMGCQCGFDCCEWHIYEEHLAEELSCARPARGYRA